MQRRVYGRRYGVKRPMVEAQMLGGILAALAVFCSGALAGEVPRKVVGQKELSISYRVDENLSGIKSVELWVTTDGGRTWQMWTKDDDAVPPLSFRATQDGEYGIAIIATDKAGNREPTPTTGTLPEAVIVVDTTPPSVRITSPAGREVLAPGSNLQVAWEASDANFGTKCIDILMSSDGGQSWRAVASGLPNTGSALVQLPGAASEKYFIKVRATDEAGNIASAELTTPVVVDGQAPKVALLGPKVSPSSRIKVSYEAEDVGGAGLAEVLLWYSTDGGRTWKLFGKDPDLQSPIEFEAEGAGAYGFFLQATDRVGNSTPAPREGARPQLTTIIDNAPPKVELLSFNRGGAFRGGDTYQIRWRAVDSNMADRPITIEYTTDGGRTWLPIARGEPNDGSFAWTLPRTDAGSVILRVSAVDALGNTGSAQSPVPFTIDATPPRSVITFGDAVSSPAAVRPVPAQAPAAVAEGSASGRVGPSGGSGAAGRKETVPPVSGGAAADPLDRVEKWIAAKDPDHKSEALAVLDKVIAAQPDNARAYYLRGRWYYNDGNFSVARKELENALSLAPGEGKYHFWLGRTLVSMARMNWSKDKTRAAEDARMAVSYLDHALSAGLETHSVYLWDGIAYSLAAKYGADSSKLDTAVERLSKAIDLALKGGASSYELGIAYFWRAEAFESKGDLKKAVDDYERAADTYGPNNRYGVQAQQRADAVRAKLRGAQ